MTQRRLDAVLARKHLPGLDGLRAVAVGLVMVYHARASHILAETGLARFVNGGLGVTLFFVLSGFLITHLLLREHERTGTISLKGFYLRRTLRIWPAYYVFLAVAFFVLNEPANPWPPGAGLSAAAFYHNYWMLGDWPARAGSITHTWSLAVEEQFYLVWPALCLWLVTRSRRTALLTVAALIVGVCAWRSLGYLAFPRWKGHATYAFDARLDSLAVGALLAIACTSARFRVWASHAARWAWAPLLVVGAIYWMDAQPLAVSLTLGLTVVPLLMALLLVQLMQLATHRGWAWLEHPVMRYLGRISFALYLYDGLAQWLSWRLRYAGVSIWGPRQFLVSLTIAILLASISYYLVERPFLRLKDRLSAAEETPVRLQRAA